MKKKSRRLPTFPNARIGLRFALALGGIYLILTFPSVYVHTIPLLHLNAWLAATVAGVLHLPVTLAGETLLTRGSAVIVGQGCDALDVMTILLAAAIATPVKITHKLAFFCCGLAMMLMLNIARLLSLLYAATISRTFMEIMHIWVWPVLLLFSCMALWYIWFAHRQEE